MSDQSHTPYDERKLKSLLKADLIKRCEVDGIDLTGTTTIATIIARMLGRDRYSGEASARASSPRASSARASSPRASSSPRARSSTPVASFTKVSSAKPSPSKGRSASASAARGGDNPVDQLNIVRERRVEKWKSDVAGRGQPWKTLQTLKHIFDRNMMPPNPERVAKPTLVILVGPAASGKSSALEMVGLGLTDRDTVRVDPDKIYEWLAHKYGYFPPEIKELKDPTQYEGESPEKYKERCANNLVKLTRQNAERLAWWLANKDTFDDRYGREFEDDTPREFEAAKYCTPKTTGVLGQYKVVLPSMADMIFDGATRNNLNVLLDTTGGMKEGFLEGMAVRFTKAGYKVVVVLVVSSVEDCIARVSGPDGRNTQQHRKLDEEIVGQIWRDFVKDETACRWEQFSHEQRNEFVVVQNTWTPVHRTGDARVVYRRNPDGGIVDGPVPEDELASILNTYKVSNKGGRFECHGAAVSASSRRGSHGHGGSSRKRRISRRRIHRSRVRKTIKKYSRPLTRRRRRI